MRWRIFFFQAEDGIRDYKVTGVQTCALPILDPSDRLWIGADVSVEAPWQQGPGEIWAVSPQSGAQLVLRGPLAAGLAVAPSGHAIVANRQAATVVVVTPDGQTLELARFTEGDVPRGLAL